MRSSKSRARSKQNRNNNRSIGNVINRVFDSSGPEGKVRGTPQQIIEKYNQLARDAQLSNDRVAAENFQQHAEHYLRLLSEAQREMDQRREQQERENRERQSQRDRDRNARDGDDNDDLITDEFSSSNYDDDEQPIIDSMPIMDADIPVQRSRRPVDEVVIVEDAEQPEIAEVTAEDESEQNRKPRKPRAPRRKKAEAETPEAAE